VKPMGKTVRRIRKVANRFIPKQYKDLIPWDIEPKPTFGFIAKAVTERGN
jgi:hypothetical protein